MADEAIRLNNVNTRLKQSNMDLGRDLDKAIRRIKRLTKENKVLSSENSKLKKRLKEFERINKSK